MAFEDIALRMTQRAIASNGDVGITLYPVRAAEVAAWLAAGNSGTANLPGLIDVTAVEDDHGEVSIDNELLILTTDAITATTIELNSASIGYKGCLYNVVRELPDGPGAREFHLRLFNG